MKHFFHSAYVLILLTFLHLTGVAQVTDKDGHTYKTVSIASNTWMAENLTVSHFNSGAAIPQAKTEEEWNAGYDNNKPLWCYVNFDPATEKKYGKLYNYHAVKDVRKLAPAGWHVSTDLEWTAVIKALGEDNAEEKLKNNTGWETSSSGENGNNETGFSAMPAGFIAYWGKCLSTDRFACFWTGTNPENSTNGWSYELDFSNAVRIHRTAGASAGNGLSVRCVKD